MLYGLAYLYHIFIGDLIFGPLNPLYPHMEIILSMTWLTLKPPNFQILYFFVFDHVLTTRLQQL